jgi:phenylacetate-CoA ligase
VSLFVGSRVELPSSLSPALRERLSAAGLSGSDLLSPEALVRLPVMRKEELGQIQAAQGRPFGGLLGEPVSDLARIFLSPGEIYDPEGARPDFWRFGTALAAAGFGRGDVVINCFNYHLSPAGFMFDAAARSLGCVVIPGGVGQQEMQVRVIQETGAVGFVGLPSYLLSLLERGSPLPLRKAFVSAEPLPPTLRAKLQGYRVEAYQGYGTADLGLIAHECECRQGMHLDESLIVEICDPEGRPVPLGEVGEVVVTLLDRTYPLVRFGTGDLSAFVDEPCGCGRPSVRMKGWMGRANDVVKVRGMFVYPRQLEEAMTGFPGVRWQAIVDRDEHYRDRLTVVVEGEVEPGAVAEAVKSATRLNVEVVFGRGAPDAKRLEDRRVWE